MSIQEIINHPSPINTYPLVVIAQSIWSALLNPATSQKGREEIGVFEMQNAGSLLAETELNHWRSEPVKNWKRLLEMVLNPHENIHHLQIPPIPEYDFIKQKRGPKTIIKLNLSSKKTQRIASSTPEDSAGESSETEAHWDALIRKAQKCRAEQDRIIAQIKDQEQKRIEHKNKLAEIENSIAVDYKAKLDLDNMLLELHARGKEFTQLFAPRQTPPCQSNK